MMTKVCSFISVVLPSSVAFAMELRSLSKASWKVSLLLSIIIPAGFLVSDSSPRYCFSGPCMKALKNEYPTDETCGWALKRRMKRFDAERGWVKRKIGRSSELGPDMLSIEPMVTQMRVFDSVLQKMQSQRELGHRPGGELGE